MTVTQRLMKPGSFSLKLRRGHPWSVSAAVAELDHIVITPSRLQPIDGFSDANVLAAACYVGVITDLPSPSTFEGAGLAWWLGTDEGLGDLLTSAVSQTSATLSTWVSALLPASITAGTVTNTGLSSLTASYQWMARREALDAVHRALGAEWRVNNDFTFDAAKSPDLFVDDPTVIITRWEQGPEGSYQGLDGSLIVTAKDVRQYTTEVVVVAQGAGATVATATASGSTSYVDGLNNPVVFQRLVNAPTDTSTNASAIAAAQVGQWNQVRRELSLMSRTYNVTRQASPGDYVYVYDPLAELVDAANQIPFRGDLITPIKLRVYALTWPIEQGMGVYARRSGATPTYTDLTDYVDWESGDVVWDVGAAPRSSNDTDPATAGGAAYLGANLDVAARASDQGAWTDWSGVTITQSGAVTFTTTWARYRRRADRTVEVVGRFAVTGGAGAAANQISFPLPVTAATGGVYGIGVGSVYDVSASRNYVGHPYLDTSTTFTLVPAYTAATSGFRLGNTEFTAALASGDDVNVAFAYEAAS